MATPAESRVEGVLDKGSLILVVCQFIPIRITHLGGPGQARKRHILSWIRHGGGVCLVQNIRQQRTSHNHIALCLAP